MNTKKRKTNAGYSMLEMMVVLAVIALIAGIAAPRLMENFGRAKSKAAEIQMGTIKSAVQFFFLDTGRYPSEAEGLEALVEAPNGARNWRGPYLDSLEDLNDPWGRKYTLRAPGAVQPFEIWTYGRDGKEGGTSEDSDISL